MVRWHVSGRPFLYTAAKRVGRTNNQTVESQLEDWPITWALPYHTFSAILCPTLPYSTILYHTLPYPTIHVL